MKTRAILIASMLAACLGPANMAHAQQQPKSVCQTDPAFHDFDFWLGDWRVTSRADGSFQGTNKISAIENGCALREEWTSTNGGTGQSINYYNPNTKKWRQVWVSAGGSGYLIDFDGGFTEGAMRLEGKIFYYKQGTTLPFRGTWSQNPDGTVRQFFEQYDPDKEEWTVWFDGLYARQKKGK
ncbi:MAG: hypothetical protein HWE08_12085 [Alphaproteobacteria bacterium]|nr:hypothetical protein [Alphaproteobacteria bacterium]